MKQLKTIILFGSLCLLLLASSIKAAPLAWTAIDTGLTDQTMTYLIPNASLIQNNYTAVYTATQSHGVFMMPVNFSNSYQLWLSHQDC